MGITTGATEKLGGARADAGAFRVGRRDMSLSGLGIAPGLSECKTELFALEEVELLEWIDLLEPLADYLEPPAASLLIILWAATCCRRVGQ